jgi:DNA polymerase III alpha subunit (gram-positive type)
MTHVFLDVEITGLKPLRHDIWEIAYAVDDGPIRDQVVRHDLRLADPEALKISGHTARCDAITHPTDDFWRFEADLRNVLQGATIVGANPAFDAAFLAARWGDRPWKYRLLDVEAYAMPLLGLTEPRGLAYIAEQLAIAAPDHSAAGDVQTLRDCFHALRSTYEELLP